MERPAARSAPPLRPAVAAAHPQRAPADDHLVVTIDRVGAGTLSKGRPLVVHGTVTNPSQAPWLQVQAYAQMSFDPATTLPGLEAFADVPADTGLGSPDLTSGEYARLGTVRPGQAGSFVIRIPYRKLVISGSPGVYRLGIKVLATTADGVRDQADAARANTLLPLLPAKAGSMTPVQAVTLLPMSAPVKRLDDGKFADDSLAGPISDGGRLSNVLAWALEAAPDTVQVAIDPALLAAVTDMSNGYRIASPSGQAAPVGGRGQAAATEWLADFERLAGQQHILLLPWGVPAANALARANLPGPVRAAVASSEQFSSATRIGTGVAGWLTGGRSGARAIGALRQAHADVQIVAQACLPELAGDETALRPTPSLLDLTVDGQDVPVLVTATKVAGLETTPKTSALQVRQRLLADATARSMSGQSDRVAVNALPFTWNPGRPLAGQDLARAFTTPVLVGQSVLGALDRAGTTYDGPVRPPAGGAPSLSPAVLSAVRQLRLTGGNLASILMPSADAERAFQRAFAMAGSAQWLTYPATGAALIEQQATADREALAKVTVTGPPFVAMSSDSGRFPLTVTNGLDQTISVGLAVIPDDPALQIKPLPTFSLPAGQRRDIQVVSTADGSGVTSVRARLATTAGTPFGSTWRFDVRATQIGLVIWIVMGAGGVVLFTAAGYRIVNRLRGRAAPRRQTST